MKPTPLAAGILPQSSPSQKKAGQIVCACGCGQSEFASRMTSIQRVLVDPKSSVTVDGARYWVRKECEEDFLVEKKLAMVQRETVDRLARLPWFLRLGSFTSIRDRQRAILHRTHGHALAMVIARRMAAVAVSPEWLAKRLVKRWKARPAAVVVAAG